MVGPCGRRLLLHPRLHPPFPLLLRFYPDSHQTSIRLLEFLSSVNPWRWLAEFPVVLCQVALEKRSDCNTFWRDGARIFFLRPPFSRHLSGAKTDANTTYWSIHHHTTWRISHQRHGLFKGPRSLSSLLAPTPIKIIFRTAAIYHAVGHNVADRQFLGLRRSPFP